MIQLGRRLQRWFESCGADEQFQFSGFEANRASAQWVDMLSDDDLRHLNSLLPWNCFTVDAHGRRFGNRAWPGKRESPQPVPDRRIVRLNEQVRLSTKRVLEVGCFEGIHTIGLCMFGATVTAVDSRIENVVKTIVRCAMYGYTPTVFLCDLDNPQHSERLPPVDVLHHVGVLYHLRNPVEHLLALCRSTAHAVMLDTHVATPASADQTYEAAGSSFRYQLYREGSRADAFSGMRDYAKWLLLEDIERVLGMGGFARVEVAEQRQERNGRRVLLYARR